MKAFTISVLAAAAAVCLSQLYPSKLNLAEAVAIRVAEPRVQNELGLSEVQSEAIAKIVAAHSSAQDGINRQMASAKPSEVAGLGKKLEELDAATARQIVMLLEVNQKERLWQLAIQDSGPFALRSRVVARKVGLTAAQSKEVEKIAFKTSAELNVLSEQVGKQIDAVPNGPTARAKRDAISKNFLLKSEQIESKGAKAVMALLSKAQAAKWKAVQGKPFRL